MLDYKFDLGDKVKIVHHFMGPGFFPVIHPGKVGIIVGVFHDEDYEAFYELKINGEKETVSCWEDQIERV